MASELRFAEVRAMLVAKGYFLERIRGSHHYFKKTGGGSFAVPVHHGKVKPIYVSKIKKL
jgi:predicted RNA binding protein YcfA (HicA-like mRNA interferase family)